MLREATYPPAAVNVLDVSSESMAAFQVFMYGRFWVFTRAPLELPWHLRSLYEPLYESLILPTGVQGFRTTGELFNGMASFITIMSCFPARTARYLRTGRSLHGFTTTFLSFPA